MSKTNIGLVAHCEKALKEKWVYVYGSYGQIGTTALKKTLITRWSNNNKPARIIKMDEAIKTGNRFIDCYALVKSYLWWAGDKSNPIYVSKYDKNANGAYNSAKEKGSISTLPEIPGLVLWMNGHVAVYLGNGRTAEASASNHMMIEGKIVNGKVIKGSKFTHWFKDVNIEYVTPVAKPIVDSKKNPISKENISKLTELGVISSPTYWIGVSLQYLNELCNNAILKIDKNANRGITDYKVALRILVDNGIISSPEYWIGVIDSGKVKYLDGLIVNLGNKVK